MKTNIIKTLRNFLIGVFAVAGLLFAAASPALAAGTVIQLYLSPASTTQKVGDNFAVDIRLSKNDNTFVNYVRADLTFPANILTVRSVSTAGSYFAIDAGPQYTYNQHNNTAGTIDVAGESSSVAKSGDFLVATIHFTVKTAGTALVAFTGNSEAAFPSNGENILTGKSNGTYTIPSTAPTPDPTPDPTPNPTPDPTPNPSTDPTFNPGVTSSPDPSLSQGTDPGTGLPPTDTTVTDTSGASQADVPTITNVHVTHITSSSAKVTWQTDVATTGVLEYGTTSNLLTSNISDNTSSTSHIIPLSKLASGKKIYFAIVASTQTTQSSHSGSFSTASGSKLASTLLVGGGAVVALLLAGLSVRNLRRRKPPLPAKHSVTDLDTARIAPATMMPIKPDAPLVPPAAMPAAHANEQPLPPPPQPPNEPIAEQPAITTAPIHDVPTFVPSPVPALSLARTPIAPPTLPPQPSIRPQFQPLAPSPPPEAPMPPLVPPRMPTAPRAVIQPQFAAPAMPSAVNTPVADADDIPDMFEEGERRLEQEEQAHQHPDN